MNGSLVVRRGQGAKRGMFPLLSSCIIVFGVPIFFWQCAPLFLHPDCVVAGLIALLSCKQFFNIQAHALTLQKLVVTIYVSGGHIGRLAKYEHAGKRLIPMVLF